MTHEHVIVDSDKLFMIDPITRSISTESPKLVLVQGDHNSERYTFSVPANIEGHDMVNCNRIEIHYTNLSRNRKLTSKSVYLVQDAAVGSDALTFSWKIDRYATVHAGSLQFHVSFLCMDENNEIIYQWSTDTFTGISILARADNAEAVAEEFPDVIGKLVDDYYAENPPAPGKSATVAVTRIDGGHKVSFEDINGIHEFVVADGATGNQGIQGIQGVIGPEGPQGPIGETGVQGEVGPQGIQGLTGDQGPQGVQGIQGEVGPKGDKGDPGESGVTAPLSGFISFGVDPDGNFYAYSAESEAGPSFEYDEATGQLYYVTEQE